MIETVFLLWHVHEFPDQEDEVKLLGVYSSASKADQAKGKLKNQPGFADHPQGFHIDEYRIDEVKWTEGFVTVLPNGSEA